jgi:radical SAM-linked protein
VRIRFRFAKTGKVRFTSHRDVARLWERALRRAELPVASTQGFSPRPKVHFGLALPTGHESLGEYLDVDLREPECASVDPAELPQLLTPLLPAGLTVEAAALVDRPGPSLQEAVTSCSWRIEVPGADLAELTAAVERLLAAPEAWVTRERKGRPVTDDIRPAVAMLAIAGSLPPDRLEPGVVLEAELATQPRGVRPSELLAALEPPHQEGRVCRTHQWIALDGARREPLPAPTTWAPHAQARAS